MHIQPVLLVHLGPDVILQVLRGYPDVHGVRYLHGLALRGSDLVLLVLALLLGRTSLGRARLVDRGLDLLDSLLDDLIGRLGGLLGLVVLRLLGRGGGSRLRENVLAKILNDLKGCLAVDL